MKISLKKPSIIIAIITTIILILALVFIPKTSMLSSLIEQLNLKEGTEEEVSLDNWEISTVFYDSTVDEGKTPLTEINWDASDGSYKNGETRIITVQVNYKNTSAATTYKPGELKLNLNRLFATKNQDFNWGHYEDEEKTKFFSYFRGTVITSANDDTHTGYDWNLVNTNENDWIFTNAITIEEKTNFEGTIQVQYTLTPQSHVSYEGFESESSCTYSKKIKAYITENVESNEISFDYKRTYNHPWGRLKYTINKTATKIASLDGLKDGEYYWVKYNFNVKSQNSSGQATSSSGSSYPNIGASDIEIRDTFPEDCVVYDSLLKEMTSTNNQYIIKTGTWDNTNGVTKSIYVGYPKSIYNEDANNLNITNHVELYSKYDDSEEYTLTAQDDESLNLSDFEFEYKGNLYSISINTTKDNISPSDYPIYSQALTGEDTNIGNGGKVYTKITANAIYTGKPMDIKYGSDILYITTEDGTERIIDDSEYYYSSIIFPGKLVNGNNLAIAADTYECELWIRTANSNTYTKHENFKNFQRSSDGKTWKFEKEDAIVGYYFIIKNMKESLKTEHETYSGYSIVTINNAKNISEAGNIYGFAYLQVSSEGNVLNTVDLNSYSNTMTRQKIAEYDLETYNNYLQRSSTYTTYSKLTVGYVTNSLAIAIRNGNVVQDANNECFNQNITIGLTNKYYSTNISEHVFKNYGESIEEKYKNVGWELYDLLPEGVELTSTAEEIINTTSGFTDEYYGRVYSYETREKIPLKDFIELVKNNTTVEITENWNNTNRTHVYIKIDLTENPIWLYQGSFNRDYISYTLKTKISYDSYFEYGRKYVNRAYAKFYNRNLGENGFTYNNYYSYYYISDNGIYNADENDINKNNDTEEKIMYEAASTEITPIVSTHQDTTTYVKTDKSNYSTGIVEISNSSNYEYKVRVRTGSNKITKLTIYSNLEESHNSRTHWKGEFLGIDTTYAEAKGYTIKTYYSEKTNATNMKDDTSWKEYTDTTDKTKVKSLAFVYLDEEGNPAILPENSLTYVLIKMKSPADESIKSVAYNSSWTEWTALDDSGEEVDFITGINSNTVKLKLPNSIEPVDIEINLEKIWDDNNNELGLRPNEITYQIIPNNDSTKAIDFILNNNDTSLTDPNKWTKNIEVPKFDDNGDEIEYTINEVIPTLENNYTYIKTINNYSITNQLARDLIVTKKWIDNNNSYLTRPSNAVIKVLQNNKEYKTVTITGDYTTNEWSNSITVPVYDAEGNEYTYTLEELKVDNYSTTYDSTNLTFTNKLTGEEKITITKEWLDNSNTYNTRPLSIDINLNQNNKLYKKITLSGTTNIWKSNEITVPKYDDNGIKYNYTIEEINTLNEYGLIDYDQNSFKITNKLKNTTNITITKTWIDGDNAYNTRPKDLTITLLQNGKEYKTITLNGTTNTWTTSIEVPKYDENQSTYKYTIKEVNEEIISIYSDISYSEDGFSITNRLNEEIDLTITKKWIDNNNEYKTRPSTVKINLYQDDIIYKSLELSGDTDTWTTEIKDVPVYNKKGLKYTYTIKEEENNDIGQYQKITYDQTTLTVTNELTEKPKVTLYFTVKNGYTTHDTDEVKFDSEGLTEILKKYDLNPDDEYLYEFELENTETKKVYKGNLSTQGILEFPDLPYGTYRALQKDDEYFDFVKMINLEDVPGVKFTEDETGGIIEIEPTGEDIIYGVNIVNKITMPVKNVDTDTGSNIIIMMIIGIITAAIMRYLFLAKKQVS